MEKQERRRKSERNSRGENGYAVRRGERGRERERERERDRSGRYAKNLKLSRVSRQARKRETDAVTTGPRETENAPRRGV